MDDRNCMKMALRLAALARGMTSPNPMVGAVVVKAGRVVGKGYHKKAGTPHAEVIALENAGRDARGATLYVSLEPCSHTDKRTPPCADAIIASGVRKVVVAMKDPNPKVSGRGIQRLRRAGIRVESGLLEAEARLLNEAYAKHITSGLPFVILKVAMTLDGKIATPDGKSHWITGEKSRRLVHRLRGEVDAVLTAIGTVRADDPLLTCRIPGGRDPVRVVIDPDLEIDPGSRILTTPPRTLVVTRAGDPSGKAPEVRRQGAELITHRKDRVDLTWLMKQLGGLGIMSVMVEAGSTLSASCLEAGIVDKAMFFIAPKIIRGKDSFPAVGGPGFQRLADAHRLVNTSMRRIGEDFLVEGYIVKQEHRETRQPPASAHPC